MSAATHSLKLPPFIALDAPTWFKRIEVQFRIHNIRQNRKADHVLAALPEDVFSKITSQLDDENAIDYNELKDLLLKKFIPSAASRAERIRQLSFEALGEQKATDAWIEMEALAKLSPPLDMLKELWLCRLPAHIRAALPNAAETPAAELAEKAQHLIEAYNCASNTKNLAFQMEADEDENVQAAAQKSRFPQRHFQRQFQPPQRQFQPPQRQFQPPQRQFQPPQRHFKRQPQPQREFQPPQHHLQKTSPSVCWYHTNFGNAAYNCQEGCTWPKKRQERPLTVVAAPSTTSFRIEDPSSGQTFLVDTGATRSIIPPPIPTPQPKYLGFQLVAANNSIIKTYGWRIINVNLNGNRYSWNFLVADVRTPLLGADFLSHHNLLVDVRNQRLIDSHTHAALPVTTAPYAELTNEYQEVFRSQLNQTPQLQDNKHGVYHYIKTEGPPVYSRFRRLPPNKLKAAKKAFSEMEKSGICQKASSPWASPLHLVEKPDGSWRPCGDYRRLNMKTEPDKYPLPNIADVTSSLHEATIFSKIDLLQGYFQVPVNPADIPKTAIITPFGSYTFNYSCFGLKNSGATFQRMMDGIFGNLDFCICYIDDILIFSKNEKEHRNHIKIILEKLKENGLIAKPEKCVFGKPSVTFLGHNISAEGVKPLE